MLKESRGLVVQALVRFQSKKNKPTPEEEDDKQGLVAKALALAGPEGFAEGLGESLMALLESPAVPYVIGAVALAVFGLSDTGRRFIASIGAAINRASDSLKELIGSEGNESLPYSESVSPPPTAANAPQGSVKPPPAPQSTPNISKAPPLVSKPQKDFLVTGELTIKSEAFGNRNLITNTKATESGADSASYGAFQLTGKTLKEFLAQSSYKKEFAGLKPGTKEFTAKWKEITLSDRGDAFIESQRNFLVKNNLNPFVIQPLLSKGIRFENLSASTREYLFSAVVNTPSLVRASISSLPNNASEKTILTSISNARLRLFSQASEKVRVGLLNRAFDEASFAGVKISLNDFPKADRTIIKEAVPEAVIRKQASPVTLASDTPQGIPQGYTRAQNGILIAVGG